MVLSYEDPSIIDDAASLLNYFLKRQTSFSREDRQNMKKMIYQFLPDFFFATSSELSDEDDGIFEIISKLVSVQYQSKFTL